MGPPPPLGDRASKAHYACMSLYRRYSGHGRPYFVTTNTADRNPIFSDSAANAVLIRVIEEIRAETRFHLHAWVMMPDHIHLVASTPDGVPIGRVMGLIKGRFANRWNRENGTAGAMWQSRFHERALRSPDALRSAIDYIHMNPVVAGLVDQPQDYRWSSAAWWARRCG